MSSWMRASQSSADAKAFIPIRLSSSSSLLVALSTSSMLSPSDSEPARTAQPVTCDGGSATRSQRQTDRTLAAIDGWIPPAGNRLNATMSSMRAGACIGACGWVGGSVGAWVGGCTPSGPLPSALLSVGLARLKGSRASISAASSALARASAPGFYENPNFRHLFPSQCQIAISILYNDRLRMALKVADLKRRPWLQVSRLGFASKP